MAGGSVDTTFTSDSVTFDYDLTGVDPNCVNGAEPSTANSCGIHFHKGTSCDEASSVEGHFYSTPEDPWSFGAFYNSSADGTAKGTTKVQDGEDLMATLGKVFVLHDYAGIKFSCTVLFPNSQLHFNQALGPYPGYAGEFMPKGEVWAAFVDTKVKFAYNLKGLDPACTEPDMAVSNSCGMHIHEGTSCDDASLPGGHFYNPTTVMADPWVHDATYKSFGDGTGYGWLVVEYGYDIDATIGRVMVLHDKEGKRMSCTFLMQPASA